MKSMTNEQMAKNTGEVASTSKVTGLLYTLMRDHIPPGIIEKIVTELEQGCDVLQFTNGYLANYAILLDERLHGNIEIE